METKPIRRLDMNKIRAKESIFISSEVALADIEPFDWSEEVLSGKKKITVTHANN